VLVLIAVAPVGVADAAADDDGAGRKMLQWAADNVKPPNGAPLGRLFDAAVRAPTCAALSDLLVAALADPAAVVDDAALAAAAAAAKQIAQPSKLCADLTAAMETSVHEALVAAWRDNAQ
jgi:hypothetical protein